MVRIKNQDGRYICLAWASKDASKAFEFTEELAAKAMLSAGLGNCILETVEPEQQRMTPAQENAYRKEGER